MASADLGEELYCSVCLEVFTDPVTLRCGHNFCWSCINCVLDKQEKEKGFYTCPECSQEFQDRSSLYRNVTLRNIAEHYLSAQPANRDSEILCSYCTDSKVPAVKSCLHCDALLCTNHLSIHNKAAVHVISQPSICLKPNTCSIHKQIFKYFCTDDSTLICAECLKGQHREHEAKPIDEALEKKKTTFRTILEKITSEKVETEKSLKKLKECKGEVQGKAAGQSKRVTALFTDIVKHLGDLQTRVLSEISGQEEELSLLICGQIQQMETKQDKLCRNVQYIEELFQKTDPLTILQEQFTAYSNTEREDLEDKKKNPQLDHATGYLNDNRMSQTLLVGLSNIISIVKGRLQSQETSGLLLDIATAANNVNVSNDMKGIILTKQEEDRPETTLRFQKYQVLSKQTFSSGRYYWEVLASESGGWRFGMTYPSVQREGPESSVGDNDKSWCLRKFYSNYAVRHNGKDITLAQNVSGQKFRVCLDYEAGQLSFYELGDHMRHLYTFTSNFTEPLHAALYVIGGTAWVRITS